MIFFRISIINVIADGDSLYVVTEINITGNKKTLDKIILRELTFKPGDTISTSDLNSYLQRNRDNVMNTSLFNFVTVEYKNSGENRISIEISLVERWYIWPVPIFEHAERNLGAFIKDPDWDKLNYGIMLNWNNFRGRREVLSLKSRFGYREQYALIYQKPNFGYDQKIGILAGANLFRQHEIMISISENKPVYLKSYQSDLFQEFGTYLNLSYRNYLYILHSLNLNYFNVSYNDSTTHLDFLGIPNGKKSGFFVFEYMFEYDIRDSKYYPLKGQYLRVNLKQRGPGTRDYNYNRTSAMIVGSYHKRWSDHWFHNQALRIYVSPDKREPVYYRTGIGYTAYLRGYELNTVEGTSYGILSNNLKYCLFKERAFNLPAIPWTQFNKTYLSIYANLFCDVGYARGQFSDYNNNSFNNRWLYSNGLGIEFVSYYDQVLRFEISLNHLGNPGFFIHTETPFRRW